MRIHGDKACSTSPLMPALLIGIGTVMLGAAEYATLTTRGRTATTQRDKDGQTA